MRTHKLSVKIAVWIILVSLVLTAISSALVLKFEYDKSLQKFSQDVSEINTRNKNTLQHILWIYDTEAVTSFLSDIVDGKKIHYAKIELNDGGVFSFGVKKREDVLHREFHIIHNEQGHDYHLGHFTVEGNLQFVKDAILKRAFIVWGSEFLKAIFVSLFVTWLLRQLFVKHLEKLAEYAKKMNLSNLATPLKLNRKKQDETDEISVVADAINDMRINLLHEIEKSKKTEKELFSFKNAVENGYNVILITDLDKKITYVNDMFEEVTGYKKEEVIGKNPRVLKSNLLSKGHYDELHATLSRGEKWEGEFINKKKDGTIFYERASVIPIIMDGKIVSYLAIKLDITSYKESEQKIKKLNIELEKRVKERTSELEETIETLTKTKEKIIEAEKVASFERDKAQEASKAKSVFLANISHELKTPLNGITGLAYLSQLRIKDEEVMKNLNNIQLYSKNLLRLISDLLDASKSESHELKIINAPFNLSDLLTTIKQLYKEICEKKGLVFEYIQEGENPPFVQGDSVRLYQVITNLLNNAVKFSNEGKVTLHVKMQMGNDERVYFHADVTDEGIGIDASDLKNIFNPFYQTEVSQHYYVEGSGLGLNICKSLIEQMGGEIEAKSKVGEGSTFSIELPLKVVEKSSNIRQVKPPQTALLKKSKVLVVDDKKINQDIVCGILMTLGIECSRADTGKMALEMIKNEDFSLVLMDIKMPMMDGHTCAREIRKEKGKNELPIIALSANYTPEDRQKAQESGMDDYIPKPIDPETFIDKIASYLKLEVEPSESIIKADGDLVLDINEAINRFVNNEDLYKKALQSFIKEYGDCAEKIKRLAEEGDEEELLSYLHSIKGLGLNLSAKKFSQTVIDMHRCIRAKKPYKQFITECEADFEELRELALKYLSKTTENSSKEQELLLPQEEVLKQLKEYAMKQSTKALSYFMSVKGSIKNSALKEEIEEALNSYDFERCLKAIEEIK